MPHSPSTRRSDGPPPAARHDRSSSAPQGSSETGTEHAAPGRGARGVRLASGAPLVVLLLLGCRPFPLGSPFASPPSPSSDPASVAQRHTDTTGNNARGPTDASRSEPHSASDDLRPSDANRDAEPELAFLVVGSGAFEEAWRPFETSADDAERFADISPLVRSDVDEDDASAGRAHRTAHRDGEVAPVVWDPLDSLGSPDAVFGPDAAFGPDDSADLPARYRVEDDLAVLWPTLKDDVRGLATWQNAGFLAVGLGTALAFRPEVDDRVRTEVARHPQRWGEATEFLGNCGNVEYQIPVLFALYGVSLWKEDERLHSWSTSSMSALTVTGLTTLVVKAVADTDRPSADWNDGRFGFPSYHTSSSFALAAVAEEHYGPWIGLPAYAAAGLIGWSRIDAQDHDLSDVVFGAALGYTIGKTIAHRRLTGDPHWQLLPLSLSSGHTTGLAAAWDY